VLAIFSVLISDKLKGSTRNFAVCMVIPRIEIKPAAEKNLFSLETLMVLMMVE